MFIADERLKTSGAVKRSGRSTWELGMCPLLLTALTLLPTDNYKHSTPNGVN